MAGNVELNFPQCIFYGRSYQCGTYMLKISIERLLRLSIGRLNKAHLYDISPGEYIYVGSALGKTNRYPLYRRIMRHARRSASKPSHQILPQLEQQFFEAGLGKTGLKFSPKKLFWNIDYLLDSASAELAQVVVFRSENNLEHELGLLLENDAQTSCPIKKFGANDSMLNSHLFKVPSTEKWWNDFNASVKTCLS